MNINTITLEQPAGPKASTAPQGGNSGSGSSGSFQVAYARTLSDSDAPLARDAATANPSRGRDTPSEAAHTVRAGETLYAIVRARLAAMGVEADAKASMQGVKQLAQANNIPNPDRIYVGQKLDLAPLESTSGEPTALPDGGIDESTTFASAIEQLQQRHFEESVPEADAQITAEAAVALQSTIDTLPPTIVRDDGAAAAAAAAVVDAMVMAVADVGARTPLAVRQVALYEQDASIAPARPAEAVRALPDIVYKGVVGKVLDAMPLEPSTRTGLQQASAVVSSTASAHALGVLTGFGGPLLTVAGLIWGIFSARQIGLIWGIFSARQINAAAAGDSKTIDAPMPAGDLKLAGNAMQTAQNYPLEARN